MNNLIQLIEIHSAAFVFVTLIYITNPTDIFYLTGQALSKGKLFLYGEEKRLYVDGRYLEEAKQKANAVVMLDEEEVIQQWLSGLDFDEVWFDPETSYSQFLQIQKMFPGKVLVPKNAVQEKRMVKTDEEIGKMERSAKLNSEALSYIRNLLYVGAVEKDIAWEFEKYCREKGASKMAFSPIVAFGSHTSMPHYRAGERKLTKNDAVICDVGIVLDDYCSDLTRSFYFGEAPHEYAELEKVVREAHAHALTLCKPGVKLTFLDQEVRRIFKNYHRESEYKHSLGHSLGLEVHEFPTISSKAGDQVLKVGMVVTIEPGLYVDGKWGYRHEDTIVITNDGYRNFYESGNWTG